MDFAPFLSTFRAAFLALPWPWTAIMMITMTTIATPAMINPRTKGFMEPWLPPSELELEEAAGVDSLVAGALEWDWLEALEEEPPPPLPWL